LETEVIYSSKGIWCKLNKSLGAPNAVYRINYLNILILLGYKVDKETFLFLGPKSGYLIVVREVYQEDDNFNVSKSYPPKVDIDLDIGINYKITDIIGIEDRYNYDLNTFYDVDLVDKCHGECQERS
jgi:hypothetical protein